MRRSSSRSINCRTRTSRRRSAVPSCGRVANVGQTVNVGSPLFEIANFKPLLARIFVPAKELGTLREGQEAEISLDSNGDKLRGAVRLVSPVVDPSTGTVKVTVGIHEYPAGTRPGDFVHVSVVTRGTRTRSRSEHGGLRDRGERVVYVANDSLASRRPVQVGLHGRNAHRSHLGSRNR
jgi:multidrug efflux pump subunit AcrA (membrane-fusion protein)